MSLISKVPQCYRNCVVTKCHKECCKLKIDVDKSDLIIVDCDLYSPVAKHGVSKPDYIILLCSPDTSELVLLIVELKAGRVSDDDFIGQLREGVDIANELFGNEAISDCFPVLVHRGMEPYVTKRLGKNNSQRIRFRGRTYNIAQGRCGVISILGVVSP